MWTTEHTAETAATPEAVWDALRDLHTGAKLSDRSDTFEIHGPFAVGTQVSVTPQGQDSFNSTIIELVEGEVYADETEFNGLTLQFRHTLAPIETGGTRITHTLVIEGPTADQVAPELGPQISEDFPAAMDDLIASATRRASASTQ